MSAHSSLEATVIIPFREDLAPLRVELGRQSIGEPGVIQVGLDRDGARWLGGEPLPEEALEVLAHAVNAIAAFARNFPLENQGCDNG